MNELNYISASSLAKGIQAEKFSCREIMQAYLDRISAVNPHLNAVVQSLDKADALAQATKADALLEQGKPLGKLHGLPITIKDHIKVKDFVMTRGCVGLKDNHCNEDASLVSRLKQEGAIIIGITNMPEFGPAFESNNDVYGRSNNPYDLTKTPGGSSGGEAAIISAGGSAMGIGSDGGGSIRVPAHFCGIAGLKPTQHLISCSGNVPADGGLGMQFYTPGPMARYVEDLKLLLPIISGWDGIDPYIMPFALPSTSKPIKAMRIGYLIDHSLMPDAETQAVMQDAIKVLGKAAADVLEIDFININQIGQLLWETYFFGGDKGKTYTQLLDKLGVAKASMTLQHFLDAAAKADILDATELRRRFFEADQMRMQALQAMQNFDVIICPSCATPAKPHNITHLNYDDFKYTMAFNLLGWPAGVVRCGQTKAGLPISLQIIAKPWQDYTVLEVAEFLEKEMQGWQPPQAIDAVIAKQNK